MKRRDMLKLSAVAAAAMIGTSPLLARSKDPIKVGILHSLSGTMAISETSLKDVALMTIDEINKSGGVLGRKLEPVVVDPASELAAVRREGAPADHAGQGRRAVFGCWTSVSRKSVLPVFEELNSPALLPGAVRGRRNARRACSTRAPAPNQQAIPAVGIPDERGRRRRKSASSCWAPTTSTRARRTRFCVLPARARAWPSKDIEEVTPRSAIATTRPSSPTSRSSRRAARRP